MIFDPQSFLTSLGPAVLIGLALMVFVESGLLFPFLPGDSLLFTAGLLAASGVIGVPVWLVVVVAFVAAAAGDQVGYLLGRTAGRRLFKPDARLLKTRYLDEAEAFFQKYGGPALVLGRFVPVVRTYVPLAAGAGDYGYRRFVTWNLAGAAAWTVVVTTLGVLLGQIDFVRNHIDVLSVLIVLVSVVPIVISALRRLRKSRSGPTGA
ncbi:DedA family protein [Frondihabitans australicus]|uniref:Membrane-associated protein n=1 Tax=Frondihabitans australicus TaxID=386892 RepID=A0A495IEK7_9MICO|nr:VTT domain-containing protein [Frondihabitans australicus]RKR73575.1 membrane-associated protein [Frondihabitans australicus]